jgi:GrpB-like predicted nucleotidyltransferase (UPF0157 family)
VVVPSRPEWPDRAAGLLVLLKDVFGPEATRLDHIGSTSIPGMSAKDVIDLQVSATDLDEAFRVGQEPLAELGFSLSPYRSDHVPAGRDDAPDLRQKRLWIRRGAVGTAGGDVNLHLRRAGSPNERLALLFRDWFRAHSEAVPAYGAFKEALAGVVDDTDVYSDVKDPVVDLVIAVAESWASSTSWRP